jgi:hypothetical protein
LWGIFSFQKVEPKCFLNLKLAFAGDLVSCSHLQSKLLAIELYLIHFLSDKLKFKCSSRCFPLFYSSSFALKYFDVKKKKYTFLVLFPLELFKNKTTGHFVPLMQSFQGIIFLLNQEKLFRKPKKTCLKLDNIFLVESWGGVHE